MPPEMRTRATLRSAEFGFLGVVVYTRVQTPRRWGAATFFLRPLPDFRPGVASFLDLGWRPLRISCAVLVIRRGMLAAVTPPAPWRRAALRPAWTRVIRAGAGRSRTARTRPRRGTPTASSAAC